MVANQKNHTKYNIRSAIYTWDNDYKTFTHFNYLDTTGASDVIFAKVGKGLNFLVLTNFYDGYTTNLHSTIYHIQNNSDYIPYQFLPTKGAMDVEFFVIKALEGSNIPDRKFLAFAEAQDVPAVVGNWIFGGVFLVFE